MSKKFHITSYEDGLKPLWDSAARRARQSSFLFQRDFMDYHRDRFEDVSLIVLDSHDNPVALLPANVCHTRRTRVESHGGLTYGGLLLLPSATTADTLAILNACLYHYSERGFTELLYKPVPHIYHAYPAEEDLYALFRLNAKLCSRAVSSVIDLRVPYPFSTLRKRKAKKADSMKKLVFSDNGEHLDSYWNVLEQVLARRHHTKPVHTAQEMRLLMERFPQEIRLFTALANEGGSQHVVAGCVVFLTSKVVHVQYIAASDEACRTGALDWLFQQVTGICQSNAAQRPWLDFGISTEQGGTLLNEGLIFQKEGFGARAICYDAYEINMTALSTKI